jgi:effector-binding domain-containing protein
MNANACQVEEVSSQEILSSRARGGVAEIQAILGRVYGEIAGYLAELGEAPAGAPFVIYYNEDMQDLEMEIGFPVSKKFPTRGDLKSGVLPAGKVATVMHRGPYSDVEQAYQGLTAFMQQEQLVPVGHVIEYYLNDPAVTPAAELLTKIMFPLK